MMNTIRPALVVLTTSLLLGTASGPAFAAERDAEEVTLSTADGVRLAGVFYPSRLGLKAPCVVLLHDLGKSSSSKGLHRLATHLQRDGCAVLRFDFRGHGDSQSVRPEFWDDMSNRQLVKGYRPGRLPEQVAFADFQPAYLPALTRDIMAAKQFLDERNDAGECNSGQTILVGSGDGASLGSLWLGWEMCRFRAFGAYQVRLAEEPEGDDVAGAVWLNLRPKLGGRSAPVLNWLKVAQRDNNVLVGFIHDPSDSAAKSLASQCEGLFKASTDDLTLVSRNATSVARKDPADSEVIDAVAKYVAGMRKVLKAPQWHPQDFVGRRYFYTQSRVPSLLAKDEGDEHLRVFPPTTVAALRP